MISETVNAAVPNRRVLPYQRSLYCPNHVRSCVFKNHETATEIINVKVVDLANAIFMLAKTCIQFIRCLLHARLPPSLGNCFPNINWQDKSKSVDFVQMLIIRTFASIVQRINTCARKIFWRGQMMYRRPIEKPDGIHHYLCKYIRTEYVQGAVKYFFHVLLPCSKSLRSRRSDFTSFVFTVSHSPAVSR